MAEGQEGAATPDVIVGAAEARSWSDEQVRLDPVVQEFLRRERSQVEVFYRDVIHALDEWMHAKRGASLQGSAVVVKNVARRHGIEAAERVPLPRLTRGEFDNVTWEGRR